MSGDFYAHEFAPALIVRLFFIGANQNQFGKNQNTIRYKTDKMTGSGKIALPLTDQTILAKDMI